MYDDDGVYLILVKVREASIYTRESRIQKVLAWVLIMLFVCSFVYSLLCPLSKVWLRIFVSPPFLSTAFWLEIPLICILLWTNDGWMDDLTWLPLSTRSCLLCR